MAREAEQRVLAWLKKKHGISHFWMRRASDNPEAYLLYCTFSGGRPAQIVHSAPGMRSRWRPDSFLSSVVVLGSADEVRRFEHEKDETAVIDIFMRVARRTDLGGCGKDIAATNFKDIRKTLLSGGCTGVEELAVRCDLDEP